jgi:hypothetical protein
VFIKTHPPEDIDPDESGLGTFHIIIYRCIECQLKAIGARSLRGGEGELGNSKILTYG